MARYYLGIDSGTQSTKLLVVDDEGNVRGRGQAEYGLIEGLGTGHKEQDPATWIDALRKAFVGAVRDAGIDPGEIAAIGVSGQQHGFVPIDSNGEVIRPAKLWCDTSTAPQAERLMEALGGREAFQQKTGNALPAGFTASKILWLKENEPESFARLAGVLLPHDFLNFWLTGETSMEWGDASGTGVLDVNSRAWCLDAIRAIDQELYSKLPRLSPSWEPAGTVRSQVADEWGLSKNVIVSAGGGDNMMGAIGTGNVRDGMLTVSLGTSGTVYACSDKPIVDPKGEIAAFCDSTGKWLPLLCTMNVTVATEYAKKLFGLDNEGLGQAAASVPAGSDGLMLIPYFEGERVPNVPDGTGVWFGYRDKTNTPGHFCRAAIEGVTMGLNYGFNRLCELGLNPSEARLTGGGSKSPAWRQILADVFGVEVVCTAEPEGAALGAAIQAKWCLERQKDPELDIAEITNLWVAVDESTRCGPNAETHETYIAAQKLHDALSATLRGSFAQHRALIG